jgi:hypothetical protein
MVWQMGDGLRKDNGIVLLLWDCIGIREVQGEVKAQNRIMNDRLRFCGWFGRGIVVGPNNVLAW